MFDIVGVTLLVFVGVTVGLAVGLCVNAGVLVTEFEAV